MKHRYTLNNPLAKNQTTDPDAVWIIKKALAGQGFYVEPPEGASPYLIGNYFRESRTISANSG